MRTYINYNKLFISLFLHSETVVNLCDRKKFLVECLMQIHILV